MSIRTAIVGYGAVARSHLSEIGFFSEENALRAEEDPIVELIGCADLDADARQRFQEDTGGEAVYESTERMLQKHEPHYIHICTCADAHTAPVVTAAEAGVHVLCEKPLAAEPAECDRMIDACRANDVQFVVSHQRRCNPQYWHIRRMIENGRIGKLRYITAGGKQGMGGRILHNIGSHLIDASGIFAGEIDWVRAQCSVDGRSANFDDRQRGDRGAGWILGDRVDLWLGYRHGCQGRMMFNEDPGSIHWILWGTEGRIGCLGGEMVECETPELTANDTWVKLQVPDEPVETASGYRFSSDWKRIVESYGLHTRVFMMRELFFRMKEGGEHTSSGEVGAVPIEVMQGAFLSHLNRRKVNIPAEQRRSPLAGPG